MAARDAPTVPETIPVPVERWFVESHVDAARRRLRAVPAPFDREEIPNGVVRARLNRMHDSVGETLGNLADSKDVSSDDRNETRPRDSVDAPTPFERLARAADVRADAYEVRAAWRVVEEALTVADVREMRAAVLDDAEAFAADLSYAGNDPVRAAIAYAEGERRIRGARSWLSFDHRELSRAEGSPFDAADVAEDVERARIDVEVGSYLLDRFRETTDGSSHLRGRLDAARGELRHRVDERAAVLPEERVDDPTALVDRDVGPTAGVLALGELADDARYRVENALDANSEPTLATDCLTATRALVYLRAFVRLRERIESGDPREIDAAADVTALRADAVAAVRAARDSDRAPAVIRAVLPDLAEYVERGDSRFERASDAETVPDVSRDALYYVVAAETCRALPPVAAEAAAVLRRP
jgi:hypothetical protein